MATGTINNVSITKILIDSIVVTEDGTHTISSTKDYSLLYIELEGNANNLAGQLILNNKNSVFVILSVPATSTIKVSCNINI
ncbi:MAG: hypothetical protein J6Y28_04160 [Acholeplasmatales bacterium]|nr:hypothetical protein [Methanobrevibacter sp.]MBP5445347.1 hypothetical protein [Acholeplasmatales bacterium]